VPADGSVASDVEGASTADPTDGASTGQPPDGASVESPDGAVVESPDGAVVESPDGAVVESPDGASAGERSAPADASADPTAADVVSDGGTSDTAGASAGEPRPSGQ
jgi:hypothetical protein